MYFIKEEAREQIAINCLHWAHHSSPKLGPLLSSVPSFLSGRQGMPVPKNLGVKGTVTPAEAVMMQKGHSVVLCPQYWDM